MAQKKEKSRQAALLTALSKLFMLFSST